MIPNIIIISLTVSGSGAMLAGIGKFVYHPAETMTQALAAGFGLITFAIVIIVLAWALWAFSGIVKEIQNKQQDPHEKISQVNQVFEPIFALLKMLPKPSLSAEGSA